MYPEDRVLVGVINRQRDLRAALNDGWYRIPQSRLPYGLHCEYIAFYLSGVLKDQPSGVHYFARPSGLELAYRRDLLPAEADHPRADQVYYRVALSEFEVKTPPILNPSRRPITFIHTTWDRFVHATQIRDLYSENDYYVDRLYHVLRDRHIQAERYWETDRTIVGRGAGLRILCEGGTVEVSTEETHSILLDSAQPVDVILREILDQIARSGGPILLNLPDEG